MQKFTLVRAGLLVTLGLLGSAHAAKVKIGFVAPMSGPLGVNGEAAKLGAQMALQSMKDELSRAGYEVSFVEVDEVNITAVAAGAKALASDPEVLGVLGPTFSGTAMIVSDMFRPSGLLMLSGSASAAELTDRGYPNVARTVARTDAQGSAMAEYLVQRTQLRKVLLVSDNTAYGNGLADDFSDAAKLRNLTVVTRVNTNAKSGFEDVVALTRASKPDVVYFSGAQDTALALLRELRGSASDVVFAGGSAFEDPAFLRNGAGLVKGVLYTTTFGPLNRFVSGSSFTNQYTQAFNKAPNIFSAFMHDTTRVMLKALVAAKRGPNGMPSRADVAAAVRKVSFSGVTGPISFNSKGDRLRSPLFVIKVNESTGAPEALEKRIVRAK